MSTAVPAAVSRRALRLVLFGRPEAGKSSLLGALEQAARTETDLLGGELTDVSQALAELQKRVYEGQPPATTTEIQSYPIRFQSFADGKNASPIDAVVIDCDGAVVNRLLEQHELLASSGSLAQAIMVADALVLVVDAAVPPGQLEADFAQFAQFLRLIEHSRGHQVEITGLPVFIALTKADLLIHPGETKATQADWLNRMDERKRQVAQEFREFMARRYSPDTLPFGQVHLESVRATAIRQPAFADRTGPVDIPYGVAELFRQALSDAAAYRLRRRQSNRGLLKTVMAGVGLGVLMFSLLGGLVALAVTHHEPGPLEQEVDRYIGDGINYTAVSQQIADLTEWVHDPAFQSLPEKKQETIQRRLQQLRAYQDYENRLNAISNPLKAQTVTEVSEIANRLEQLHAPKEYADEWRKTEARERQAAWAEDATAMRNAGMQILDWYQKLIHDGKQVLDNAAAPDLPGRARKVLNRADEPPFPAHDPKQPLPGSKQATYDTVLHLQSVADARQQWDEIRKRLVPLANVNGMAD